MTPDDKNKSPDTHLDFPELFPLEWENETPDELKNLVINTKEKVWETTYVPFSDFVINYDIDDGSQRILEKREKERMLKAEKEKKLTLLFNHFNFLRESYTKLVNKYPEKIGILQDIFENIWIIKTSKLYTKRQIVMNIIKYIETENLAWLNKYVNELLWNWEWKAWFPREIWSTLFNIQTLCTKLFPHLDIEHKFNAYWEDVSCKLTNAWWGKIR